MLGENPKVKDFESVPFQVKNKDIDLQGLKQLGLPASLVPVMVQGKTYFMHQNYYQNNQL